MTHSKKRTKSRTPRRKSSRLRKRSAKGLYYDEHFSESTNIPVSEDRDGKDASVRANSEEILSMSAPTQEVLKNISSKDDKDSNASGAVGIRFIGNASPECPTTDTPMAVSES